MAGFDGSGGILKHVSERTAMSPARRAKRPELPALTGVRAVAAAMVVLSHIRTPADSPGWVSRLVESGYIGVPLFFILSGFVMAYNYGAINPRSPREVWNFYVARAARVLPLYYAVLLYLAVRRQALGWDQLHLLEHVLNIQTWGGSLLAAQQTYNGPAWSINVELFFYLIFPFLMPLILAMTRKGAAAITLTIATALFVTQWLLCVWFAVEGWADLPADDPSSGHRWLYRHPLPRVIEFAIGICLALLNDKRALKGLDGRFHSVIQISSVGLALFLTLVRPWEGPWSGLWRVASFGALYTLPFAVLLLSLATNRGVLARLFSTPIMISLGVSSFALYMTHRPFLEVLGADVVRDSSGWAAWLFMFLLLGFTMLIGEGTYRYVEDPCRKLVLRLRRRAPRDRATTAPEPDSASGKGRQPPT